MTPSQLGKHSTSSRSKALLYHRETLPFQTPHTRLATKCACASFIRMIISKRTFTFANNSTSLLTLSIFKLSTLAPRVAKSWLIVPTGLSGYFNRLLGLKQRCTRQLESHGSIGILLKYATGLLHAIATNAFQGLGAEQQEDLEHVAPQPDLQPPRERARCLLVDQHTKTGTRYSRPCPAFDNS
jgi:hypothetical protein